MATNNRSRELQNVIRRLRAASNQGQARLIRNAPTEPITIEPATGNNGVARLGYNPEASTTHRPPVQSNSSKQGGRQTRKNKAKRKASKKSRRGHRK